MENVGWILLAIFVLVFWGWVCRAVGLAAKAKGRSRSLWTVVTFFFGPIGGPLWLASFPVVGEKSTVGQLIGRTILIVFVLANLGRGVAQTGQETLIAERAEKEFGYETQPVKEHYKKMSVSEIVACVKLEQDGKAIRSRGVLSSDINQWQFDTQIEADKYNDIIEKSTSMECQKRTYDYSDLSGAMAVLEKNKRKALDEILGESHDPVPPALVGIRLALAETAYQMNSYLPMMIDDSTRLDKIELGEGAMLVHRHTLTGFDAREISQQDISTYFRPEVIEKLCKDSTFISSLELGGFYVYHYSGKNGDNIGQFEVAADDC
ncbi:hypothetical protein N9Q31_03180 [Pseudomonadales bacterium]|nr:hypothetical protein [Pseudomonadales bacterium]